jgi:hypothetical protein
MKEDFHLEFGMLQQYLPFILAYTQHFQHLNPECEKLGYYLYKNTQDTVCRLLAYQDPELNVFVYGFNNKNEFECCGRIKPNGIIDFNFKKPEKAFPLELLSASPSDFQRTAAELWHIPIPKPDFELPANVEDDDDL